MRCGFLSQTPQTLCKSHLPYVRGTLNKGFSLIEVLAAITILSGVLFAASRIISASYIYASKIHNIYLGTELCRLKLHDVEEIINQEGLPEDETEEEGEFEEREYEGFRWKYSIKRVFIPLPDFSTDSDDGSYLDQSASMLSLAKGNIEDFFKERIRKLTVSVFWGEGIKESEKVVFTIFLTTKGTVKTFQQYTGENNGNGKKGNKNGNSPKNRFDGLNKGGNHMQNNNMFKGGGAVKGK
ncbi:prepilin-type N-terminal cleavage/methylation domain-containing protein [bacterium]|nr:prepilin-type N-terminal cleavage/methylation domain-containing protein [bacterium]